MLPIELTLGLCLWEVEEREAEAAAAPAAEEEEGEEKLEKFDAAGDVGGSTAMEEEEATAAGGEGRRGEPGRKEAVIQGWERMSSSLMRCTGIICRHWPIRS